METERGNINSKWIFSKAVAMLLWAFTAVNAGMEIFFTRAMTVSFYYKIQGARSIPINIVQRLTAAPIGNIASLIMAIVAIAIVVGGFEYHWKYAGEHRSYKTFAWTFAFQLTFWALYLYLV